MRILGVIGIALLLAACTAGPLQREPTNAESGTASHPEIGQQVGGGGGGGM